MNLVDVFIFEEIKNQPNEKEMELLAQDDMIQQQQPSLYSIKWGRLYTSFYVIGFNSLLYPHPWFKILYCAEGNDRNISF